MMRPVIIASVVLLLGGLFGNFLRFTEQAPHAPSNFSAIPLNEGDYTGEERRFSETSYDILQADTTTLRRYIGLDGDVYWLFVAYFASQKYGSQIHSPKHCLPGGGWQILRHEPFELDLPGGKSKKINRLIIADRGRQQLMFYWYETRGGAISNEFGLKWDLVMNSLMLRPTDAAIIRLTLPIREEDGVEGATERAQEFFRTFYPDVAHALPFAS